MKEGRKTHRSRRGGTLVIIAVSLVAMMSAMALAIDMGMLFKNRSDAQRTADAAALAGASAYLDVFGPAAVNPARDRAVEYLGSNKVGNDLVDTSNSVQKFVLGGVLIDSLSEAVVTVMPNDFKVRVEVRRPDNDTWFANLFGKSIMPVRARATAIASPAGAARCLKPFALPDIWHDQNGDVDGDHVWDMPVQQGNNEVGGEIWKFGDDPGDYYSKFDPTVLSPVPPQTGYGSTYRTDVTKDWGREIKMKVSDPNDVEQAQSGIFFPWTMPNENLTSECKFNPGGGETGAASYRANICNCNTTAITLNTPYPIKTGNMIGPTHQGVGELINMDKNARWDAAYVDPETGQQGRIIHNGTSPYADNPMGSPRVIKVAMYNPTQITKSGMQTIQFNNFAMFFIEEQKTNKDPVKGRFLFYVSGDDAPGPSTGPLVRVLRLVE
jgi:hypothetical protein